jgi:maleate isomerase
MITPYMRPLTDEVAAYVRSEGIEVSEAVALEVADNVEVGRLDPAALVPEARRVAAGDVDAIVLSACVQMPSLPVVQHVEDELGVPVLTAATATARELLLTLGLEPVVPGAGRLLAAQPAVV